MLATTHLNGFVEAGNMGISQKSSRNNSETWAMTPHTGHGLWGIKMSWDFIGNLHRGTQNAGVRAIYGLPELWLRRESTVFATSADLVDYSQLFV